MKHLKADHIQDHYSIVKKITVEHGVNSGNTAKILSEIATENNL